MEKQDLKVIRKYIKDNSTEDSNGCWIWDRVSSYDIYGRVSAKCGPAEVRELLAELGVKYATSSHKVSFLASNNNTIPEDKPLITHKCGNRLCCRPTHLRAGTYQTNCDEAIKAGTRKNSGKYRKNPQQMRAVKKRLLNGESMYSIAKYYNRRITAIKRIRDTMIKNGELIMKKKVKK